MSVSSSLLQPTDVTHILAIVDLFYLLQNQTKYCRWNFVALWNSVVLSVGVKSKPTSAFEEGEKETMPTLFNLVQTESVATSSTLVQAGPTAVI